MLTTESTFPFGRGVHYEEYLFQANHIGDNSLSRAILFPWVEKEIFEWNPVIRFSPWRSRLDKLCPFPCIKRPIHDNANALKHCVRHHLTSRPAFRYPSETNESESVLVPVALVDDFTVNRPEFPEELENLCLRCSHRDWAHPTCPEPTLQECLCLFSRAVYPSVHYGEGRFTF
jgi:hypothetical protein